MALGWAGVGAGGQVGIGDGSARIGDWSMVVLVGVGAVGIAGRKPGDLVGLRCFRRWAP